MKKGRAIWNQEQGEIEKRLGKDGVAELLELLEKLTEADG